MKYTDYVPVDRAKFDEMIRDARGVERKDHLQTFTMCWLLDQSYPRADIAAMLNIIEHEKGWR